MKSKLVPIVAGLAAVFVLALFSSTPARAQEGAVETVAGPSVIFLVRHAEKQSGSADPALTEAGTARAEALAAALRHAQIDRIHSSDYARTRDTAQPAAAALGLEVELYDPRDLRGLVGSLRAAGGRHLVVGHSNTTPAAVQLLGGDPGDPIEEATEYDRLYIVTLAAEGAASTVRLHYGG